MICYYLYICIKSRKKREKVKIIHNILIEFKFHDTYLTHGAYKILNLRMEGIQSRAPHWTNRKLLRFVHYYFR